jgi:aspartate aminotransferase
MTVSKTMLSTVKRGSMVRKMFEEGRELKASHGEEVVFDFSLGNPDLEPPAKFGERLREILGLNDKGLHGYMPNAGLTSARESLARYLGIEHGVKIEADTVIMTVGAAGAMNVVLKTITEPGDEVIALAPFFMEYVFYAENHGVKVVAAETDAAFRPDLEKLVAVIGPKTRALIINSPNNPTGAVYTKEELKGIGDVLSEKSNTFGRPIVLISDEPYRKIVFGSVTVPSVFEAYQNSVVVSSFSKDLSLAGERIGYLCPGPALVGLKEFVGAAALANRILGFVNAPALMQRAVSGLLGESVDIGVYEKRSVALAGALKAIGYNLVKPGGTFYLFPESPIKDDLVFVEFLKKELILAVPGTGFSRPGYFRLSLCLNLEKIIRSIEGFKRAFDAGLAGRHA